MREIQNDELEFKNLFYKEIFEEVKAIIERNEEILERQFTFHDKKEIRELAIDIFTSRYELSKVWKRKESYVELPGENLGIEVPKSLLIYKLKVVEMALDDVRNSITDTEKKGFHDQVIELLTQQKYLDETKNMLSNEIGERIILY